MKPSAPPDDPEMYDGTTMVPGGWVVSGVFTALHRLSTPTGHNSDISGSAVRRLTVGQILF
ncbi:glycosyl transferase family 2 [Anopheles sinensis]|uniref:Glycosyl transferase family 2 n=1 Tax=Anopheles sinensis TaxID=74873 RepID=A0A084WJE2_ANOSI|nr:glycosyl transferase family 2 [Anopheles sinensis]